MMGNLIYKKRHILSLLVTPLLAWGAFADASVPVATPTFTPELLRTFETELPRKITPENYPYIFSRPLVFKAPDASEKVVVSTTEGTVYYLDALTARKQFKLETLEPIFGAAALLDPTNTTDPTIVVASEKGKVYLLDSEAKIRKNPETQLPCVYRVEGKILASPVVTPAREILVATSFGQLYFLNEHADLVERVMINQAITATPAITKSSSGEPLALIGTEEGSLFVVSLLTRKIIQTIPVGSAIRSAPAVMMDAENRPLWIVTTQNALIRGIRENGETAFETTVQAETGFPATLLPTTLATAPDGTVAVASLRTLVLIHRDLTMKWWKDELPGYMNPGFHSSGTLITGSDARGLSIRNQDLSPRGSWPSPDGSSLEFVQFGKGHDLWFFGQEVDGSGTFFWIEPHPPTEPYFDELVAHKFPLSTIGAYSEPAELADGTVIVARVDGKVLFFRSP